MEGKLEKDYARLGKFVGDIVREDVPKFLYDLAIKIDEYDITFDDFVKRNNDDLDEIVNRYLV